MNKFKFTSLDNSIKVEIDSEDGKRKTKLANQGSEDTSAHNNDETVSSGFNKDRRKITVRS